MTTIIHSIRAIKAEVHFIEPTKHFPNSKYPLILYKKAITLEEGIADPIIETFSKNEWSDIWINGIYPVHHYHSSAHEVLGVFSGCAKIQFGGPDGIILDLHRGDIIIIPAGVAHKNTGSTHNFSCVGAYPQGQHFDMNYGEDSERPFADEKIAKVTLPKTDPVYGPEGELIKLWV